MVERSIAWLVQGPNRKLHYIGEERNRLWLHNRVAAVNLKRVLNFGLVRENGA
jgi:hypothetical protein